MESVQEATVTLGEAARRLDTSVDAVLSLIYEGRIRARPDPASGRLLIRAEDLDEHIDR